MGHGARGGGGIEEGNKEHEIREKEKGRLVNELNVNTELKEGMLSGSGEVNTYIWSASKTNKKKW